jgi:prepilin-type N-terminal cleavage/methylation domain-containing protein
MSRQQLKEKGFTIIEVVLVLAIAALIFLMVFIALPALQRTQRDDARKKDVSIVASAIQSWQGNNRSGTIDQAGLVSYVNPANGDTSSSTQTVTVVDEQDPGDVVAVDADVTVYVGLKCGEVGAEGKVQLLDGTARQYAIATKLESGNGSGFCLDA